MAILSAANGQYLALRRNKSVKFKSVKVMEYGVELVNFCFVSCFLSYYSELL